MRIQDEVDREVDAVRRITAVARRRPCTFFADLLWGGAMPEIQDLGDDPGVMFESPRRVVVLQRVSGELRYYAGGWCPDQDRIYLEQDRVWAEGSELGIFASVRDALLFAEQYLAEGQGFGDLTVPRQVRYSRHV
jgi:hypothetical protein